MEKILILLLVFSGFSLNVLSQQPAMLFGDSTRLGRPLSKDPHVILFQGRYLMYYSVPGYTDKATGTVYGWGIGIAESKDLIHWNRVGEVNRDPAATYESKGYCAPCARVIGKKVHLFYQTYGNGKNDAICHAWSTDGIQFTRNSTNPIFHPDGAWNCGRAIDAEVIKFKGKYFLYYATRDPDYKIQMQGVAVAPGNTSFNRGEWTNQSKEGPMLKPDLPWEKDCIEGASIMIKTGNYSCFTRELTTMRRNRSVWQKARMAFTGQECQTSLFCPMGNQANGIPVNRGTPTFLTIPKVTITCSSRGTTTKGKPGIYRMSGFSGKKIKKQ